MLITIRNIIFAFPFIVALGFSQANAGSHGGGDMIVEKASPLDFEDTVDKVIANGKDLGWKLPKKWKKNFQKNLMKVTDVDVGRNLVIEMCEPYAAAELLVHDQYKKFLSMMPCSVAVYEKSDGKVYLSMMNIQMMGRMYKGQKEIEKLVNNLGPQMEQMLDMNRKIAE